MPATARVIDSHEELKFLPHNRDKNIFGTQRIYRAPVEFFPLFIEFVTSHHLEESMTEWNELMRGEAWWV